MTASKLSYTHDVVASADGITTFNISLTFTPAEDDLPEGVVGVFVKRVGVVSDPKTDTFVRVAVLSDLGKAASSRDIAVDPARYQPAAGTYIQSAGNTSAGLYLTPSLTMVFDNLSVAIRAKTLLEQRIDSLISDWKKYRDEFYAVTETEFPLQDSAVVAAAKAAYYTAADQLSAAQGELTTAEETYDAASDDYNTKNTELERILALQPYVCTAVTQFNAYSAAHQTYFSSSGGRQSLVNALTAALSDSATSASIKATLTAALNTEVAAKQTLDAAYATLYSSGLTAITTGCTTLNGQQSTARSDVTAAQNLMGTTSVAKTTATALVAQRQTEKDLALASALSVCPSFVP